MRFPFSPAAVLCLLFGATFSRAERLSQELSTGWKFALQKQDAAAAVDSWETVALPHSWNAHDMEKKGYYRGEGWYAFPLEVPQAWRGKRVFVLFESAALVANTYLNGQHLGEHRGAFTAFSYELTPCLRYGARNDLRVQVDNSAQPDVPPLDGDFNISGGLCRPAHLIVTDQVCVTPLYFASPGVFLTTKSLTGERAQIEVKTMVSNGAKAADNVEVETEIQDAGGRAVATRKEPATIPAGGTLPVTANIEISQPHLWNGVKDPYLYTAVTRILRNGTAVDEVRNPLGLRTVEISEKEGFLLNGKPYPIHGVNRHQDFAQKGAALTAADHERDLRLMREMGVTAVRLAHYPQAEYFHQLCDRSGVLLWNEVSLVNKINNTPEFKANAEQQLRELILQRYNHPSVAFWGLFNELDDREAVKAGETYYTDLVKRMKEVVRELDTQRIIVGATCRENRPFNQVPDRLCYNLYPGWYSPFPMSKFIDRYSVENGKRLGISEYGAGANPAWHREGELSPGPDNRGKQYQHSEEWQAYVHERDWKEIKDNPALWGSFVWAMFDFACNTRNEGGIPCLNDKGLVTRDRRTKKDAYYFYQANWAAEPMVHITSHRMTPRTQPQTEVKVYSNAPEVALKVNGKSLGTVKPGDLHIARWQAVSLQPGGNQVEASAVAEGKKLTDTCSWVLNPQ